MGRFSLFANFFVHDCKIRIFFEIFFQTITFSKTLWHKNGIKKKGRSFSNSVCHKNGDFFPFAISSFSSLFSQRIQNFFRIFAKNENAKKLASIATTRRFFAKWWPAMSHWLYKIFNIPQATWGIGIYSGVFKLPKPGRFSDF